MKSFFCNSVFIILLVLNTSASSLVYTAEVNLLSKTRTFQLVSLFSEYNVSICRTGINFEGEQNLRLSRSGKNNFNLVSNESDIKIKRSFWYIDCSTGDRFVIKSRGQNHIVITNAKGEVALEAKVTVTNGIAHFNFTVLDSANKELLLPFSANYLLTSNKLIRESLGTGHRYLLYPPG